MKQMISHVQLVKELSDFLRPVLEKSPQAIYLYLDDNHKTCNQKFVNLLGYKSVKEWVGNRYPLDDVDPKDQAKVVKAYMDASKKFKASTVSATLTKRNGKRIKATMTSLPISYKGAVFVLYFVS